MHTPSRKPGATVDAEQQRRIANNEVAFRAHNEAIQEAVGAFQAEGDDESTHGVMCECAIAACEATIELTMAQYEEGRSDPAWFIVVPEHVVPDVEHLVHDRGSHWIIAKEALSREIAEAQAVR